MIKTETIDEVIKQLKDYKKEIKRMEKLSDKRFNMTTENTTIKRIQSVDADLNRWYMYLDKQSKKVWKCIKESWLEVGLDTARYCPSWFHDYK